MTDQVVTPQQHLQAIVEGVKPFVVADDREGAIAYVGGRLAEHSATMHNIGTTVINVLIPAWERGPEAFRQAIRSCNVRSTEPTSA
jgi:hypothetical protein